MTKYCKIFDVVFMQYRVLHLKDPYERAVDAASMGKFSQIENVAFCAKKVAKSSEYISNESECD